MCHYVIGHTTKGTVLGFGISKVKSKVEFKRHYLIMIVFFWVGDVPSIYALMIFS